MQGLTEMDAYLLVVDGVPYGGSFNPNTASLDLIDFDRIEVVRGAAPVTFGATSFVGVIHVIRTAAGEQPTRGLVQFGTRDSGRAAFATSLSTGSFGQSLLASLRAAWFFAGSKQARARAFALPRCRCMNLAAVGSTSISMRQGSSRAPTVRIRSMRTGSIRHFRATPTPTHATPRRIRIDCRPMWVTMPTSAGPPGPRLYPARGRGLGTSVDSSAKTSI